MIPNPSSDEQSETSKFAFRGDTGTPWLSVLGRLTTGQLALLVASVGVVLSLPALWSGFAQDDFFFLMIFKGAPGLEFLNLSLFDTFSFSKGDPATRQILMERGFMPWWAAEDWKINFFRPLSALSHWLDFQLFGEHAWVMHLHSLLLYGVLAAMAAVLYRRFIEVSYGAGVAALLFAVDSGHAIPATWLAMRNALISLLFGLLVLWAHDQWRRNRRRWWPHAPLALFWLVLGLLTAEASIAVGGYLLGYALFLDPAIRGDGRTRLLSRLVRSIGALLPYLAVVIVWRVACSQWGYGTEGSGLYIDPAADAGEFLRQLPARMAVLLLGLFAFPDAALWTLAPEPVGNFLLVASAVFLILLAWTFYPLLRDDPVARFLALGAFLSVVPACATLPMDRNLMYASFGALGVVAMYLTRGTPHGPRFSRRAHQGMAALFIFAHGIVAPIGLFAGTQQLPMMNRILTDSNPAIPVDLPPGTRVVGINTPTDLLGASLPIYRSYNAEPLPEHWWWLYAGVSDLTVTRAAEATLLIEPEGPFLPRTWAEVFRLPENAPLVPGARVQLDGLAITVETATEDGRPQRVRFDFDVSLEDSSLYFVWWSKGTYLRFTPPAPGETVRVPGPRLIDLIPIALAGRGGNAPVDAGADSVR